MVDVEEWLKVSLDGIEREAPDEPEEDGIDRPEAPLQVLVLALNGMVVEDVVDALL